MSSHYTRTTADLQALNSFLLYVAGLGTSDEHNPDRFKSDKKRANATARTLDSVIKQARRFCVRPER